MSVIETKELTKYYGDTKGIDGVNLKVKEGEIFGFIGPNGSGKSTTIRTLLNLIYPTSGEAKIFDKDCIKNSEEIKRDIGYLPDEVNFYDDMNAKEFLKYSASFYKGDFDNRIEELAEILELDLTKSIEDLSMGNKKKVAIVQALLHEPKLLILDEPTSGLDPLMQNKFFELLREARDNGATIFFSSHILSEVQKLCDRVAIIKNGKILKVEGIEDIRKNKFKYVKIYLNEDEDIKLDIDGIANKETNDRNVKFLYKGKINDLLKKLMESDIQDVTIEEPSLEDVFMHYYEKEEE